MVNDACCLPPVSEGVEFWENPPEAFSAYGEMIGESAFPKSVVDDPHAFIDLMDEENIEKVLLHGEDSRTKHGVEIPNKSLSAFAENYENRLYPLSGFDPHSGNQAVEKLERGLSDLDMAGVVIQPIMSGLPADDEKYMPAYRLCDKYDALVWIHSSIHHVHETSMYKTHPRNLDGVLRSFPNLPVIAGHAGWPWVLDLVGLLMKYDNLYTEISAWRPKYFATQATGWGPLMKYGNTILSDRILFGSNWPGFGEYSDLLEEFDEYVSQALSEDSTNRWLGDNLETLL